jgi:hypothetical protein
MLPATAWDGPARGWSVMGRLGDRQAQMRRESVRARRTIDVAYEFMVATPRAHTYETTIDTRAGGRPSVLAFLFAFPDSATMQSLDHRGDYFNVRTGRTWDLFFPGYYQAKTGEPESRWGSKPVGTRFASDWFFNPHDFNDLRQHVEDHSAGLWAYSGGTDLVLVNIILPYRGIPTIDWKSTQSGSLDLAPDGKGADGLPHLIECISRDLESGTEDPSYGVSGILHRPTGAPGRDSTGKQVMIGALGDMLAAFGKGTIGMS